MGITFLPLTIKSTSEENDESKFLRNLREILEDGSFYFANNGDITLNFQQSSLLNRPVMNMDNSNNNFNTYAYNNNNYNNNNNNGYSSNKIPSRLEYVWNKSILKDFDTKSIHYFFIHITRGYICSKPVWVQGGEKIDMAIIL